MKGTTTRLLKAGMGILACGATAHCAANGGTESTRSTGAAIEPIPPGLRTSTGPRTGTGPADSTSPCSFPSSTSAAAHPRVQIRPIDSQIMSDVKIYGVVWGANGNQGAFDSFVSYLASSSFFTNMSEYGINSGTYMGVQQASSSPPSTVQDSDVWDLLDSMIPGQLPDADGNTLYIVYLPPGVSIPGLCTSVCGYHGHDSRVFHNNNRFYAVIPDNSSCSGCGSGVSDMESVTSHEIAEAITDPTADWFGPMGWYDQQTFVNESGDTEQDGEVGDICAWQEYTTGDSGQFTAQCIWSNSANTCVPMAPATSAYTPDAGAPEGGGSGGGGYDAGGGWDSGGSDSGSPPDAGANPCSGVPSSANGPYCGSSTQGGFNPAAANPDIIYDCENGVVASTQVCPGPCVVHSFGQPDSCN